MIITKFGGTSVSSAESIQTICNVTKKNIKKNPVVVVSALSGITDLLLSLSHSAKKEQANTLKKIKNKHLDLAKSLWSDTALISEIESFTDNVIETIIKRLRLKTKSKSDLDNLVSWGEILSSLIISRAISQTGIPSRQVIATDLIATNNEFGSAEFIPETTRKQTRKIILPLTKNGIVPVVTGFIGATQKGEVTTLGRGGSDYTAAILGYSLDASEIQIWTDVDGIFTTDPRIVKDATQLEKISYREASEMATFGAKVLHPRTIRPAIQAGIPVRVCNTFNPTNPGTVIVAKTKQKNSVTALAYKKNVTLINIYSTDMLLQKGFLSRIFNVFSTYNISVDLVSVSEVSVSVTLDNEENVNDAIRDLSEFSTVSTNKNLGIVSLIGEEIVSMGHILKKIFTVLDNADISVKMISLGATDINISVVISSSLIEPATKALHKSILLPFRNGGLI